VLASQDLGHRGMGAAVADDSAISPCDLAFQSSFIIRYGMADMIHMALTQTMRVSLPKSQAITFVVGAGDLPFQTDRLVRILRFCLTSCNRTTRGNQRHTDTPAHADAASHPSTQLLFSAQADGPPAIPRKKMSSQSMGGRGLPAPASSLLSLPVIFLFVVLGCFHYA
jgi:hypothetical protein